MIDLIRTHTDDSVQRNLSQIVHAERGGWANGYVGVPDGHPWYQKGYDDIEAAVHGGLTYAQFNPKFGERLWWVGFDTMHYNDNRDSCDEQYVLGEVESLKQQAITAAKDCMVEHMHHSMDDRNIQPEL